MTKLTFTNSVQANTTVLENEFIDKYMKMANGEYVKVYLLLLRHLNNPDGIPTISALADMLQIYFFESALFSRFYIPPLLHVPYGQRV